MFARLCENHPRLTEVTSAHLQSRAYVLATWPRTLAEAMSDDPRCGCAEDGSGVVCQWDDYEGILVELESRGL